MNNKIEDFFKDKLQGFGLSPSEEAWAKVEANLSKKNRVAIWRIAAAVLLVGAFVSIIIKSQKGADNNRPANVAANSSSNGSGKKTTPQHPALEMKNKAKSKTRKSPVTPTTRSAPPVSQQGMSTTTTEPSVVERSILAEEKPVTLSVENISNKIEKEATPTAIAASTKQKSIKLEFTLDDLPSEQPVATTKEVKSSVLKKVWELTREVKNGDGPVHEMKNELFALNFKKTKNQ